MEGCFLIRVESFRGLGHGGDFRTLRVLAFRGFGTHRGFRVLGIYWALEYHTLVLFS